MFSFIQNEFIQLKNDNKQLKLSHQTQINEQISIQHNIEEIKKLNLLMKSEINEIKNKKINLNPIIEQIKLTQQNQESTNTKVNGIKDQIDILTQKNYVNEEQDNPILSEILTISNKLLKFKKIIEDSLQKTEQLILNMQNEIHYLNLGLPSQPITKVQELISINNINSQAINSILELIDKRIVVCGESKDISIFSINYEQKEWKLNIKVENAHQDEIYDICEINNNILVSCSNDNTIKIWKMKQNNTLSLKSTLNTHTGYVAKVILLSMGRFASCSSDNSVKIWNCEDPFTEIISLSSDGRITNIMKLQNKEILLASNFVKKELEV